MTFNRKYLYVGTFIGYKAEPPLTPQQTTEEAAAEYIDDNVLKTPQRVLEAVSILLAAELCLEPSVRKAAKVLKCVHI
jgi:hypothetical protein